jgi:hypothetical protein
LNFWSFSSKLREVIQVINSSDRVVASRSKSDNQITDRQQTYDRFRKQNSQDSTDSKGNYKDNKTTQGYANKDRFSQSPKPQRIERRRGKFQSDWNDSRHYTDDDLSDVSISTSLSQSRILSVVSSSILRSLAVLTSLLKLPALGRLMLDNEYLFDPGFPFPFGGFWDRFSTVNLKEYLEKQGDNVDWDRDNKQSNWSDWAADVAQDDMQEMPPNWDNIKPAGSGQ